MKTDFGGWQGIHLNRLQPSVSPRSQLHHALRIWGFQMVRRAYEKPTLVKRGHAEASRGDVSCSSPVVCCFPG